MQEKECNNMRYLVAEQFLGATFSSLLKKNVLEIELEKLNRLEEIVDHALREENRAILTISSEQMFVMIEEYSDFFDLRDHSVTLQENLSNDFSKRKEEVIAKIEEYFTLGIPNDIKKTLVKAIDKYSTGRESCG